MSTKTLITSKIHLINLREKQKKRIASKITTLKNSWVKEKTKTLPKIRIQIFIVKSNKSRRNQTETSRTQKKERI